MKAIAIKSLSAAILSSVMLPAIADTGQQSIELEEVTVTARKRSERLQDIPDSVTVFSATKIEDARIQNVKDFAALTPNLSAYENFRPNLANVTIRGMVSNQLGEPPVAFVVDGVTVPNIEFVNQGLQDIQQIEVLRGPQGALYGKNAIGGAILITTKQPSNDFDGKVKATYAEGNDKQVFGSFSGPLVKDKVFYRLSGSYQNSGGVITDVFRGEEADYAEVYRLQGMLRFVLNDVTTLDLRARYSDGDFGFGYFENVTKDTIDSSAIEPTHNIRPIDQNKLADFSVKIFHEEDFGSFDFVAAYSKSEDNNFADGDFSALAEPFGPIAFGAPSASGQESLLKDQALNIEARFSSLENQPFRWLVGGLFQKRERSNAYNLWLDFFGDTIQTRNTLATAGVPVIPIVRDEQESQSYALFYQGSYDVTDSVEFTFALRYDEEERDGEDPRVPRSAASETYSAFQPKFSLSWDVSDDVLTYITYSRGFRSGGFNEVAPTVTRSFEKEISDTVELGIKSTLLDGRLIMNFAGFFTQVSDTQFSRFNPTSFSIEQLSVDEVDIKGFELEATYRALDGLDVNFGLGVIDNKIKKFDPARFDAAPVNIIGNSMPRVADWNANLTVSYTHLLKSGWTLISNVSVNALGERNFNLENTFRDSGAVSLGLNIGAENNGRKIMLFANNITDEVEAHDAQSGLTTEVFRFRNKPRQIGIEASYQF